MLRPFSFARALFAGLLLLWGCAQPARGEGAKAVDSASLRGKILCGYQGWFRAPGDAAELGWVHWSRDSKRLAPETLAFEMWPDLAEFSAEERYPVPGFTGPEGKTAELFSSANERTVQRHFEWMRDYGLDGVWLQHFAVEFPGAPGHKRYASRRKVLESVRAAARKTGRVWALTIDLTGMPVERLFDAVTEEWKRLVDEGVIADERYVREGGKPALEIFGFYRGSEANALPIELGNRLLDFFKAPGAYQAFLVGGGEWYWRRKPAPEWEALLHRLDGYSPWNVGNLARNASGEWCAATAAWAGDQAECERLGILWLPVIYPGFSWDNLKKKPPGSTLVSRRKGAFLWEQFHALSALGGTSAIVAMFDEADEGTAIFKVTNAPPAEAHFVTYEGMPSDWYLRLVGEATRGLREGRRLPQAIPIQP